MHWLARWLGRVISPQEQKLRELEAEMRTERQLNRLVHAEYQERVVKGVLTELRKTH